MDAAKSQVERDAGDVPPERAALVKKILKDIKAGEAHWKDDFDEMEKDIKFVANLKNEQWDGRADPYVCNLVLRHVQERTAALYAKNPRVRARRKERMDFVVWDEKAETLQAALTNMQTAAQTGQVDPNAQQTALLMADLQQAKQRRDLLDRVGRTQKILYHYYLDESQPRFKSSMKSAVKRAITTGIAWVKLGFQRQYEKNPEVIEKINDITLRIAHIETLIADMQDGEIDDCAAECEELNQALHLLQSEQDILVEEGLVHTFPRHNKVILDPRTRQISGYVGTRWAAEGFLLTVDQIKEIYEVDIGTKFTAYQQSPDGAGVPIGSDQNKTPDGTESLACVYEYYNKSTGVMSVVCEGYDDYLREPGPPIVRIKQFYPWFPIMFNEVENPDGKIYPPSDIKLLMHMQKEHNRSREALRQHRIANQPFYLNIGGTLSDEDKAAIGARTPHAIHDIKSIQQGQKADEIIAPMKTINIDPNMYETGQVFEDIQKAIGSQQANFGGTKGDSATEVSVAAGSNMSTLSSANDDLEECLTNLARAGGEVMLLEISPETAKAIAGPGAAWPGSTRQEMADSVYIEIIAGSNGRPNQAQEAANIERIVPVAMQVPGFNPAWIARKIATAMDDNVDLAEALMDGLPSIISMNAAQKAAQPGEGGPPGGVPPSSTGAHPNAPKPAGAPEQQGPHGANNAPVPHIAAPQSRPAMPAPMNAAP